MVLPEIALGLASYRFTGGKALNGLGVERLPKPIKLRIPDKCVRESDYVR